MLIKDYWMDRCIELYGTLTDENMEKCRDQVQKEIEDKSLLEIERTPEDLRALYGERRPYGSDAPAYQELYDSAWTDMQKRAVNLLIATESGYDFPDTDTWGRLEKILKPVVDKIKSDREEVSDDKSTL